MTRLALLLAALVLLPVAASAQSIGVGVGVTDPSALQGTLRAAIEELRALDDLVDAADTRSVQRELHRKVMRIEELLEDASRLAAQGGGLSTSIVVHDPDPAIDPVVIIDERHGHHDDREYRGDRDDRAYGGHHGEPPPVIIIEEGPMACSGSDFDSVVAAVDSESFSSGKLTVLRDASRARWFSVNQVQRLMGLFTFGKDMVDAGAILHPRTVDLENWYLVYSAFTFDSDKDKLRQRVGDR